MPVRQIKAHYLGKNTYEECRTENCPIGVHFGAHRWGQKGRVYVGEGSAERALTQGRAIHASRRS